MSSYSFIIPSPFHTIQSHSICLAQDIIKCIRETFQFHYKDSVDCLTSVLHCSLLLLSDFLTRVSIVTACLISTRQSYLGWEGRLWYIEGEGQGWETSHRVPCSMASVQATSLLLVLLLGAAVHGKVLWLSSDCKT